METHHDSDEALIAVADEIADLAIDRLRDGMGLDDVLEPMRHELAVPIAYLNARLGRATTIRLRDDPAYPWCRELAVADFFRSHGLDLAAFRDRIETEVTLGRVEVYRVASGPPDPWRSCGRFPSAGSRLLPASVRRAPARSAARRVRALADRERAKPQRITPGRGAEPAPPPAVRRRLRRARRSARAARRDQGQSRHSMSGAWY